MTKIINSIMISCFLCTGFSNIGYSATTAQLQSTLQKYGVPKASDCGTINEAYYNGSAPECQELGMFYNKTNRRCETCELGYTTSSKTDTSCKAINCGTGNIGTKITNGVCPAGYILQQITGGSCSVGSILTKM